MVRAKGLKQVVESGAVVEMPQVAKLVEHHVVT